MGISISSKAGRSAREEMERESRIQLSKRQGEYHMVYIAEEGIHDREGGHKHTRAHGLHTNKLKR